MRHHMLSRSRSRPVTRGPTAQGIDCAARPAAPGTGLPRPDATGVTHDARRRATAAPGRSLLQRLEAKSVRPRALLTETLDLVGLVLVEVAGEEHPLAFVLAGQDVRRDAVKEPAVVADHH